MTSLDSVPICSYMTFSTTFTYSCTFIFQIQMGVCSFLQITHPLFKTEVAVLNSYNWCWILKTKGKEKYHSGSIMNVYNCMFDLFNFWYKRSTDHNTQVISVSVRPLCKSDQLIWHNGMSQTLKSPPNITERYKGKRGTSLYLGGFKWVHTQRF